MSNELKGGGQSQELSKDINVITAEINAYQRVAGEAIFEIGRRLKGVRDNPEEYGFDGYRDWERWCRDSLNMTRGNANRFIKVYNRFIEESDAPVHRLPSAMSVLYVLTDFTDEELEQTYELPSGESKKPTEMSRREIEELKKALRQAEQQAESERRERERLEEENEQLAKEADKPAEVRYETKTEYIEVDNTPHDYEDVKSRLEEYRAKFGENYATWHKLPMRALYEIATLPPEHREVEHEVNGKKKKPYKHDK